LRKLIAVPHKSRQRMHTWWGMGILVSFWFPFLGRPHGEVIHATPAFDLAERALIQLVSLSRLVLFFASKTFLSMYALMDSSVINERLPILIKVSSFLLTKL
jgi:hypothetical protein